jgi:hypothetical protein
MSNLPIYEMPAHAFASERLRGTSVTDLGQFASLLRDYEAQGDSEIWNVPISDQVPSPTMRRVELKGYGVI